MSAQQSLPNETRRNLYRRTRRAILILVARHWKGTRGALRSAMRRFLKPYRRRLGYLRRVVGDARFAAALAAAFLAGGSVTPSAAGAPIPPTKLSDVAAGMGGFVINGIDFADRSGISVSGAGDVNGDGLADLIVGAQFAFPGARDRAGESYVIFGKLDGVAVELSDVAAGMGGFVINGIDIDDSSGATVSGAGDVNGDGLADLIVGAQFADPGGRDRAGESYVIFGKAGGDAVELSDVAAGMGGFVINGIDPIDFSGYSVSGVGDVNGDGLADLIVGASLADPGGRAEAGESYVVFGKASGDAVELSDVAMGMGGFVINGSDEQDQSGRSVSGAGDVNGDGLADLIVGALFADPGSRDRAGESYVIFGKSSGAAVELSDVAAGMGGFVINGIDPMDLSGYSVSGAGDVNGDGLADLIVGASSADPGGKASAGESYVIFGKLDGAAVELSDVAAGMGGFVINGQDAEDQSGVSVSAAGDINGDGLADLIVGAHGADPGGKSYAGESYVIFGKLDGAAVELSDVAAGMGGFAIIGQDAGDVSGRSVSGAGDVNGDGLDDLIVGASQADPGGVSRAGESYVIFSPLTPSGPTATPSPTPTPTPTPTPPPTPTPSPTPTSTPTSNPIIGFSRTASSISETTGMGEILVELSAPGTQPVEVEYRLTGGTATPDTDFVLQDGTLSFAPGVVNQPIPIAIVNDVEIEGDETVTLDLSMPVNATIDALRSAHVLTIVDNAGEPAGLRIDKWNAKPNRKTPVKGKVQIAGEFNDKEAGVDLATGTGITLDYDGGTFTDVLLPIGFKKGRGAKYKYEDPTRKANFLHRIGGSSRSKFSLSSRGDVTALGAVSPMSISMASDGFSDEVTFVPIVTSKGSKFKIAKNAYEDPELYIDSLLVKRNPSRPDKDSMRLTLRFPGGAGFKPESDTLMLVLDFFELTVAPNDWTRNRAGTKFVHTSQIGVSKVTIKVDQARRTLSLTGKKMTLPGPDAATPEARIGVGFGDFVKVNAVILQSKTAKSGAATFRY